MGHFGPGARTLLMTGMGHKQKELILMDSKYQEVYTEALEKALELTVNELKVTIIEIENRILEIKIRKAAIELALLTGEEQ